MRRIVALVAAVVLAAASSFPAQAAKPPPGGNVPLELVTEHRSIACNVEQQTIRWYGSGHLSDPCPSAFVVNNPTDCPWDIDDAWSMYDRGSISSGEIVTAQMCAIADGTHRPPVDAAVSAKHDKLVVRLDASDGRSWLAVPIRVGNYYEYTACGDGLLQIFPHPEVPGSNGGLGTYVTYTLTIDATTRGGNGITAALIYGNGIASIGACS